MFDICFRLSLTIIFMRNILGQPCNQNIDCQTISGGMYCNSQKICDCTQAYININNFCYPKMNPGQSGCHYDEQCSSVWPGSKCASNFVCQCPFGRPPAMTIEGPVCTSGSSCPTNGLNSALRLRGSVVKCTKDEDCPTAYDCICETPRAAMNLPCTGLGFCCPKRALACIMPTDPGQAIAYGQLTIRWSYDAASAGCVQFQYLGIGGNANNFETQSQCQSYCQTGMLYAIFHIHAVVFLHKRSVTSQETCKRFIYFGQGGNYNNFPSFEACMGYCSQNFVCNQRMDAGNGRYSIIRWYYNPKAMSCESFAYTGSGGNSNNFDSYSSCMKVCSSVQPPKCPQGLPEMHDETYVVCSPNAQMSRCSPNYYCFFDGQQYGCCPTRSANTCSLDPESGFECGGGSSSRWFYNKQLGKCGTFNYNGCGGNSNNFATEIDCLRYCSCPDGSNPYINPQTQLYLSCAGNVYGCPYGYSCVQFSGRYGSGIQNSYCCPQKSTICKMAREAGNQCGSSGQTIVRYGFDTAIKKCKPYQYNGCGGTQNNFATKEACELFCFSLLFVLRVSCTCQILPNSFSQIFICHMLPPLSERRKAFIQRRSKWQNSSISSTKVQLYLAGILLHRQAPSVPLDEIFQFLTVNSLSLPRLYPSDMAAILLLIGIFFIHHLQVDLRSGLRAATPSAAGKCEDFDRPLFAVILSSPSAVAAVVIPTTTV
ncbi:unnamed protein product [Soboliphyme baturini]|uniref:Kunitz/Bovine pancreatic trypsin inhibitor domain protein n=1 Tax=Soboliphyme baturini TaxID=241478 RepID=A0A183ICH4_9BILA|nr:unnamed protein product [Soboliphyme baturini]